MTSNGRPRGRSRRRGGADGRSKGASRASRSAIEPLHPTLTPPDIASFREWTLDPAVQGAIEAMGISVPTPIQRLAIQPVLDGRDCIAKAETGTGKTLAFGAPLISRIDASRVSVLGLVLCPTRELAEQVAGVLAELGRPRGIKVALIVGGEPMEPQVQALQAGSQVVVGTPGRVLDLYRQRFLSFPWTEFVVLDEADVMLEIGFIDDIRQILSLLPDERQTLLFSATFPPELLKLAREHTKQPAEVATAAGVATVDTIEQVFMEVSDDDRPLALTRLIEQSEPDDVFLVFCGRRTAVDRLMRRLERLRFGIRALHGGYDQAARFRVMSAFRTGEVKALVATDVASRGLDVAHVTHVVNFAVPADVTEYTHRIGRTGRAGRSGRAITFVTPPDRRKWSSILRDASWTIEQVELPGPSHGRRRASPARSESPRAERARPERSEPERARPEGSEPEEPRGEHRSESHRESGGEPRGESRRRSGHRSEATREPDRNGSADGAERPRGRGRSRGRGGRGSSKEDATPAPIRSPSKPADLGGFGSGL